MIRAETGADRGSVTQGDHGDLVRVLLLHAVACHRATLRHPVQHVVLAVCLLDPTWPVASAASDVATGLRRYPGAKRRGDRQSFLPLGIELLRPICPNKLHLSRLSALGSLSHQEMIATGEQSP